MACHGKQIVAHRYAWEQVHGPIPEGMQVDHRCHRRNCVNVDHLRLVTNKQNCEHQAGVQKNNKSGVRGVSWDNRSQKWVAVVRHNNKMHYAGYHSDLESAADAVRELRNRLFTHNDLDRV